MALDKATRYFDSNIYGESNLSFSGILSHIIGSILPCISIILLLKNKPNKEGKDLIPFVFVCLCIVILRMQIPIFFRFLNYFEVLVIVAFTHVLYIERVKIKRQLVSLVMSGMVFFRLYSLTSYDVGTPIRAYHRYVPYNSIFQKNYNKESEMLSLFYFRHRTKRTTSGKSNTGIVSRHTHTQSITDKGATLKN